MENCVCADVGRDSPAHSMKLRYNKLYILLTVPNLLYQTYCTKLTVPNLNSNLFFDSNRISREGAVATSKLTAA